MVQTLHFSATSSGGWGPAQGGTRPCGNALLDQLPAPDRADLLGGGQVCTFTARQSILEPFQPIDAAYFPVCGAISLVSSTEDGATVRVASVGREGMVGLPAFLGARFSPNIRAMAEMPCQAIRVATSQFLARARVPGTLHEVMQRYANTLIAHVALETACIRRHSVLERCSSFLLMTHDRVGMERFPLTQEFLAELLGTRRASVVTAARTLLTSGVIEYRRGSMRVLDRPALEGFSCGCHRAIGAATNPDSWHLERL